MVDDKNHINPNQSSNDDESPIDFNEIKKQLAEEQTGQAAVPRSFQVRSDSYNDFVSIQPKFFERWGVLLIAAFIVLILIATCFISYPEVVKANVKTQSINAPKALVPKVSGKVVKLIKQNNEIIKKEDDVLFIESTANHEEVLSAYEKINQFIEQLNTNSLALMPGSANKNPKEIYIDNSQNNKIASTKNILQIKGLFYTIQIGMFSHPVKASVLHNLQPLYTENTTNGMIKYYVGIYSNYKDAIDVKSTVTKMGIKQSFIKAFNNNQSISLLEAQKLESSSAKSQTKFSSIYDFNLFEGNYSQFGELQTALQTFQTNYLNYLDYQSSGIYQKKKSIIQNDIEILKKLIGVNSNQKTGTSDELKYVEEKSKNNENLYNSEVIARDDYVNIYLTYLAKKNSLYQYDLTSLNYASQINQKLRELMEIEEQSKKQKQILSEAIKTLKSQFDEWINKYIVKASETGILSYSTFIQENQMVESGKTIGMVIPNNTQNYVEMYIAQNIYPKVKLNQSVLLKFPAFPPQDYGYVKGTITYLSPISTDSTFLAKVNCDNGFITNQKIKLNVKHGMTGIGEIIIKDKTIMGRIISKFTEKFQGL